MLDSVDAYLVNLVRLIVYRLELFTVVKRKHLLIIFIAINAVITCVSLVSGFISTSIFFPTPDLVLMSLAKNLSIAFFFLASVSSSSLAIQGIRILRRNDDPRTFPEEIKTRKRYRILDMVGIVATMLALLLLVLTEINIPIDLIFSIHILNFMLLSRLFSIILEYLFCTSSLPPGEKERRKAEKETKNMLPAGTS